MLTQSRRGAEKKGNKKWAHAEARRTRRNKETRKGFTQRHKGTEERLFSCWVVVPAVDSLRGFLVCYGDAMRLNQSSPLTNELGLGAWRSDLRASA